VKPFSGPSKLISTSGKSKSGKSASPSDMVVEMLKATGVAGKHWVIDVCNCIVKEGCIPDDWRRSLMVNEYNGKGDAFNCGSDHDINLLVM